MPIYEYRCDKCALVFEEIFTRIANATGTVACQTKECGGRAKRIPATTGRPIFKGSGFYETDYKERPSGNDS